MTTPSLRLVVPGTPVPQGSKILRKNGARAWLADDNAHALKAWRDNVASIARRAADNAGADGTMFPERTPLALKVTFHMPRPAGHYGTGRNAGKVRASAPAYPVTRPDLDKLLRAVGDALTAAGVIDDDARFVDVHPRKVYAEGTPGAEIRLEVAQ